MNSNKQSANQENKKQDSAQDWLFDAFCQPRTIPDNWDLSGVSSASKNNGKHNPEAASTRRQPDFADEVEDANGENLHIYYLNPFPEPHTYHSTGI